MTAGRGGDRQRFPDELRGLALLGIVVVNAAYLGVSLDGYTAGDTVTGRAVEAVVTLLAQGKFYLVFAFLFGYSAAIMLRPRPEEADATAARRRVARRLAGLAVLGVAHALLLFVGDILVLYSLLGVALLVLARRADAVAVRTGLVVGASSVAVLGAMAVAAFAVPGWFGPDPATLTHDTGVSGGFLAGAGARWEVYGTVLVVLVLLQGGLSLAALCLGLAAGRRDLLADPAGSTGLWRTARRWGLPLGLAGAAVAAVLTAWPPSDGGDTASAVRAAGALIGMATAPALTAGYLGLLAALVVRHPQALRAFRPAGRMSLSVYLGQSLVLSAVFGGWGLGLYGRLEPLTVLGLALVTWALLSLGATVWMRSFRQGPVEFLLRWWTYGRRPAMRAAADAQQWHRQGQVTG